MKKKGGGGGCLGAPMRALSRACDSACDLYVRGMSGCARRMPSGAAAGAVGRGFGGSGAASLRLRVSSERADDLVRAASRRQQRRVAAEPEVVDGPGRKGAGGAALISAAPAVKVSARKKAAAAMGTIAEDVPCEFDADGACAAARGGFGAIKAGSDVFAR